MSVPMIAAGVILWTLNIWSAWSMISAGYPLVVVFTAAMAVLFTLAVTRKRIVRGGTKLGIGRDNLHSEPLKTTV